MKLVVSGLFQQKFICEILTPIFTVLSHFLLDSVVCSFPQDITLYYLAIEKKEIASTLNTLSNRPQMPATQCQL